RVERGFGNEVVGEWRHRLPFTPPKWEVTRNIINYISETAGGKGCAIISIPVAKEGVPILPHSRPMRSPAPAASSSCSARTNVEGGCNDASCGELPGRLRRGNFEWRAHHYRCRHIDYCLHRPSGKGTYRRPSDHQQFCRFRAALRRPACRLSDELRRPRFLSEWWQQGCHRSPLQRRARPGQG